MKFIACQTLFIFVPVSAAKKKNPDSYIRKFLLVLIPVTILLVIVTLLFIQPRIYYPGFEINIPAGFKIHGIDVSHYQSPIDWTEVKKMSSRGVRIGFVFIKATEGITSVDRYFKQNWVGAEREGLPKGAYHFYIPGRDIKRQAENFIRVVNLNPGDLPPVLDIEKHGRLSSAQIRSDAASWLEMVEKKYGVTPIIYTNISFFSKYFAEGFEKYPVWIAHYLEPYRPRTETEWIFWQHSETGRVNGISGMVDFNVFNGDSTDFNDLRIPGW